jgi:hypothetical protein
MKELELEFTGAGEVRGEVFKQVNRSPKAYIYERTNPDYTNHILYEVFKRKESKESDGVIEGVPIHFEAKVKYPSSTDFGVWAKCYITYDEAIKQFNLYSNEVQKC